MAARTPITDLKNFVGRLVNTKPPVGTVDLYRGQPGVFALKPSLFRKQELRQHEKNILRELIALHPGEFQSDQTMFERLVRMQHYSLPTRLLDVTHNPLVALYFCCNRLRDSDGEFVRITVDEPKVRYFDSDTVSCIANLANLKGRERDRLRKSSEPLALESGPGHRLMQFIKAEKPYFIPRIRHSDLTSVVAVKPKQSNRRILAQQGAFLLFGLLTEIEESESESAYGIRVGRTKVPAEAKAKILRELDRININASTLFPEVDYAAKYIMSKLGSAGAEEEEDGVDL